MAGSVSKIVLTAGKKVIRSGIISWILLVVIWQIAALFNKPEFLPGPVVALKGLVELAQRGVLWIDIAVSMKRVLIGWGRGMLLGIPLGLLIGRFRTCKFLIEPLLNFFRFIPAIGFLTLFLLWFGVGEESKLVLITYACIFPIMINTSAAVVSIDPVKYQAAESLGASPLQTFFTVTIPASIPQMMTGVRLGLSSAIVSIVAAEMLSASEGMGYLIYTSRLYYRTDWIFSGIFILGVLGFTADKSLRVLTYKLFRHYGVVKQ